MHLEQCYVKYRVTVIKKLDLVNNNRKCIRYRTLIFFQQLWFILIYSFRLNTNAIRQAKIQVTIAVLNLINFKWKQVLRYIYIYSFIHSLFVTVFIFSITIFCLFSWWKLSKFILRAGSLVKELHEKVSNYSRITNQWSLMKLIFN